VGQGMLRSQDPPDRSTRHPHCFAYLAHAESLAPKRLYLSTYVRIGFLNRAPPPALAFGTNPLNAGFDTFLDHRSLEFSKDPGNAKESLAARSRRVNALLIDEQIHLLGGISERNFTR
jgi:hypothetical protein